MDAQTLYISPAVGRLFAARHGNQLRAYADLFGSIQGRLVGTRALELLDADLPTLVALFDQLTTRPTADGIARWIPLFNRLTPWLGLRWLFPEQKRWCQAVISFSLESHDEVEIMLLNGLALAFDALGDGEKALNLFDMAVQLAEDRPDYPGLGALYHNHSQALSLAGDLGGALEMSESAVEAESRLGTPNGLARVLAHHAELLRQFGDIKAAGGALRQALEAAGDSPDLDLEARLTEAQVQIIAEYADPADTEPIFQRALSLWEQLNDTASIARVSLNYAAFLHALDRIPEARAAAERSRRLYEGLGAPQAETVREAIRQWLSD